MFVIERNIGVSPHHWDAIWVIVTNDNDDLLIFDSRTEAEDEIARICKAEQDRVEAANLRIEEEKHRDAALYAQRRTTLQAAGLWYDPAYPDLTPLRRNFKLLYAVEPDFEPGHFRVRDVQADVRLG